jgi:hypothetical protein
MGFERVSYIGVSTVVCPKVSAEVFSFSFHVAG